MSDFKSKMHLIRFPLELHPKLRCGSLQRSPDPLAVFKGPTSKGREGERIGREEGKRREGGNEGVHLTHYAFRTLAALPKAMPEGPSSEARRAE